MDPVQVRLERCDYWNEWTLSKGGWKGVMIDVNGPCQREVGGVMINVNGPIHVRLERYDYWGKWTLGMLERYDDWIEWTLSNEGWRGVMIEVNGPCQREVGEVWLLKWMDPSMWGWRGDNWSEWTLSKGGCWGVMIEVMNGPCQSDVGEVCKLKWMDLVSVS